MSFSVTETETVGSSAPSPYLLNTKLIAVNRPEEWDALCCYGGNGVGARHKLLLPVEVILETQYKPWTLGNFSSCLPKISGKQV